MSFVQKIDKITDDWYKISSITFLGSFALLKAKDLISPIEFVIISTLIQTILYLLLFYIEVSARSDRILQAIGIVIVESFFVLLLLDIVNQWVFLGVTIFSLTVLWLYALSEDKLLLKKYTLVTIDLLLFELYTILFIIDHDLINQDQLMALAFWTILLTMLIAHFRVEQNRINFHKVLMEKYITVIILGSLVLTVAFWSLNEIHQGVLQANTTLIFYSSLYLTALYLCISLGLTLTYKILGFANFSQAEYFVTGAFVGVGWTFTYYDDEDISTVATYWEFMIVVFLGFVIAGTVAVMGDFLVFKPLRKLGSSPEAMMISSIGWGILIRNILSLFYGGEANYFRVRQNKKDVTVFGETYDNELSSTRIGNKNGEGFLRETDASYFLDFRILLVIFVTIALVVFLFYFLEKTKTGKALRATADNIDLAESSGINTGRIIILTWFIGGGLAGVAGVLFATRLPVIPFSGFQFLLPAFAVVVLGGVGSVKGSVLAAFIIGVSQTIAQFYLTSFEYFIDRDSLTSYAVVVPFVVLIGVILLKPLGLFGDED